MKLSRCFLHYRKLCCSVNHSNENARVCRRHTSFLELSALVLVFRKIFIIIYYCAFMSNQCFFYIQLKYKLSPIYLKRQINILLVRHHSIWISKEISDSTTYLSMTTPFGINSLKTFSKWNVFNIHGTEVAYIFVL